MTGMGSVFSAVGGALDPQASPTPATTPTPPATASNPSDTVDAALAVELERQGQVNTIIPFVLETVGPSEAPLSQKKGVLFGTFTTEKASDAVTGLVVLGITHGLMLWAGHSWGKASTLASVAKLDNKKFSQLKKNYGK